MSNPQDTTTDERDEVRDFPHRVPKGAYEVDADELEDARQGTPDGEYHVDADELEDARQSTPDGEYHVRIEFPGLGTDSEEDDDGE